MNEVNTGFQSGDPGAPKKGEPRPQYDPSRTLEARRLAKEQEIGISPKQQSRWLKKLTQHGISGLLGATAFRGREGVALPESEIDAIQKAAASQEYKSDITKRQLRLVASQVLDERDEGGDLKLLAGSRATFNRYLNEFVASRNGLDLNAKRRRSYLAGPTDELSHLPADRPGEYIAIDSTRLDVFAIDPISGQFVEVDFTVALDVRTRSVVGFRMSPYGTKGVDLALLLADIISPEPVDGRWPEDQPYPFCGAPEGLVLRGYDLPEGTRVKPRPMVRPDTLIVDRGENYQSAVVTGACAYLGISIQSARPYRPTDKPWIERFFDTFNKGCLQGLYGYKGPHVLSRGKGVETKGVFLIPELEAIAGRWIAEYYQNVPHEGLRLTEAPHITLTPNEAYEEGISRYGFVHVPIEEDLRLSLLPIKFREIPKRGGVTIDSLSYDSGALNSFRGIKNSEAKDGRWPFRLDPRDRRQIYFQDPRSGVWETIKWRHARDYPRPLGSESLAYAKDLISGRRRPSEQEINTQLLNLLAQMNDEQLVRANRSLRREAVRTHATESEVRSGREPCLELEQEIVDLPASNWSKKVPNLEIRND